MYLEQNSIIRADDCGWNPTLSPEGALKIINNVFTELMGMMNMDGVTVMEKYGVTWVILKNNIHFYKTLKWNEEYSVKAFISNIEKVRSTVDVIIYSKGEIALYSKIEMCLLDLANQRIRRVSCVGFDSMEVHQSIIQTDFNKLEFDNLNEIYKTLVKSSDIDFNNHTNNIKYVRYIINTYDLDYLRKNMIKSFEIHYLNQTRYKDELAVFKNSNNNIDDIEIRSNGNTVIKCQIVF